MSLLTRLIDRLRDKTYRRAYVEDFGDAYLATQIKVLREQRNLTQTEFANLVGVRQSQVCRWENVNNSGWQLRSLKSIARALDVVLSVQFESFGQVMPRIEMFSRDQLERPSFAEDPVFENAVATASLEIVTGGTGDLATALPVTSGSDSGMVFYADNRFKAETCEAERCIA